MIFALLGFLALPLSAQGASGSVVQQIETLRAELGELSQADLASVAEEEIERAQRWLDEAEQLHGQRDHSSVEYRLRRVDHTVDLIRALVEVGNIERSAREQEARYEEARQETARLEEEIQELEKRKATRQEELRSVRD